MEKNKLLVLSANCATFFTPPVSLDKEEKLNLLKGIIGKCGGLLDGEPTMLPIPLDAPPDIPRLQLNSKDNSYAFGISLLRSDFSFVETGEVKEKLDNIQIELFKHEKELIAIFKDEKKWNITRLALIVNYIAELDNRASDFITKRFLAKTASHDSIELSLLKKSKISRFNINRWFRIKCIEKKEDAIHLLADINTPAEDKANLSIDEIMGFYSQVVPYLEKEIKITFEGSLE